MKHSKLLYIALLTVAPHFCTAQQLAFNAPFDGAEPAPPAASTLVRPAAPAAVPSWKSQVDRWLDVNALTYSNRYRSTFDSDGAHTFSQGQQRMIADGKFKFDEQGHYGLGFHMSSGRYFNWAYAEYMGGGMHQFVANASAKLSPQLNYYLNDYAPAPHGFYNSGGGQVYLRQLFLTAEPLHGVEFEFGGFGINHGVNTEATSYDDDGYMSGERITIKRPGQIWLSEASYTRGYLGDWYVPNFFARGQRLSESNYWQVLGRKDFGKRIAVSADFTITTPEGFSIPLKTTREAILGDTHWSKIIDSARFEAYQRITFADFGGGQTMSDGKGFALTLSRSFNKRFSFDAGIADIDQYYIAYLGANAQAAILGLAVNGDQYGLGKRYFLRPTLPVARGVSLTASFSHLYSTVPLVDIWNSQSLSAGVVFDLKKGFFSETKGK